MNKKIIQTLATLIILISISAVVKVIAESETATYHWEIGEEPSGQESVFVPQPIQVEIGNTGINASLTSGASYTLSRRYKVHLSPEWDEDKAYLLLQALQDMTAGYGSHSPPWLGGTQVIGY